MSSNSSAVDAIGVPAALEGLAEELIEAAHASLKAARALRGENPTPAKQYNELEKLVEEYTDVYFYAQELGLEPNLALLEQKRKRFKERIDG